MDTLPKDPRVDKIMNAFFKKVNEIAPEKVQKPQDIESFKEYAFIGFLLLDIALPTLVEAVVSEFRAQESEL